MMGVMTNYFAAGFTQPVMSGPAHPFNLDEGDDCPSCDYGEISDASFGTTLRYKCGSCSFDVEKDVS